MEKSEPTLIPEWLKNAGNSSGGGSASHSDNHSASLLARNKSFVNNNGQSSGRSSSIERTTSSYFRRSSSNNGSGRLRSHGSFGRNHHDRDGGKDAYDPREKDKSLLRDTHIWDFPGTLVDPISSKFERDGLRRSQSMVSGKRGETWTKKTVNDSNSENGNSNNGVMNKASSVSGVNKQTFERDFPSLGGYSKTVSSEIERVKSPGLGSALQSLPMGTSVMLGGEKWTSALAEVPVLAGSNGTATSSVVQENTPLVPKSMATGLNMAEAVVLGPNRAQTPPQLSVETQKLEELVIKQSRQLIPVTPSMPKTLVSSSSEKQKNKASQHQFPSSSLSLNQSPRGGLIKGDSSKASDVAKLHVLKPGREKNGVNPNLKDNSSPKSSTNTVNSSVSPSSSVRVSNASKVPLVNSVPSHKPVLTVLEKKPTYQAKSRNDFFNSVRKQSMGNSSSLTNASFAQDSGNATPSLLSDKFADIEVVNSHDLPQLVNMAANLNVGEVHLPEDRAELACNGDACYVQSHVSGKKNHSPDPIISEEEEAAFLRSLGWEEDDDEGGLTEEEINAFYRDLSKYINSNTSLRILQGVQHKLLMPQIASGLSSSDAKMES